MYLRGVYLIYPVIQQTLIGHRDESDSVNHRVEEWPGPLPHGRVIQWRIGGFSGEHGGLVEIYDAIDHWWFPFSSVIRTSCFSWIGHMAAWNKDYIFLPSLQLAVAT